MTNLPPEYFRRYDERDDAAFYAQPRLVQHIDAAAVARVTRLYAEYVPAGGAVLDLMSSWVSHLPPDGGYVRVAGLGMNAAELDANPQLTERTVQSLNANPQLPYGDAEFDAAVCTVSVQYLTQPIAVFAEVARVLRPGAPFVVSFSNRCFPSKAVAVWQALSDQDHCRLVAAYMEQTGGYAEINAYDVSPGRGDPLFAVVGRREAEHVP